VLMVPGLGKGGALVVGGEVVVVAFQPLETLVLGVRELDRVEPALFLPEQRHTAPQRHKREDQTTMLNPLLNLHEIRCEPIRVDAAVVVSCAGHVLAAAGDYAVFEVVGGYAGDVALDHGDYPGFVETVYLEEFDVLLVPEELGGGELVERVLHLFPETLGEVLGVGKVELFRHQFLIDKVQHPPFLIPLCLPLIGIEPHKLQLFR